MSRTPRDHDDLIFAIGYLLGASLCDRNPLVDELAGNRFLQARVKLLAERLTEVSRDWPEEEHTQK